MLTARRPLMFPAALAWHSGRRTDDDDRRDGREERNQYAHAAECPRRRLSRGQSAIGRPVSSGLVGFVPNLARRSAMKRIDILVMRGKAVREEAAFSLSTFYF